LTPEDLAERRKKTDLIQWTMSKASPAQVGHTAKALRLNSICRARGVRTTIPARDGKRAADLLDRNSTAPAPNRSFVRDFTHMRTWTGYTDVLIVVDVAAHQIMTWNAAASKEVILVLTLLHITILQRKRGGYPIERGNSLATRPQCRDADLTRSLNLSSAKTSALGRNCRRVP